jgi:hypothetical protein
VKWIGQVWVSDDRPGEVVRVTICDPHLGVSDVEGDDGIQACGPIAHFMRAFID